MLARHGLVGVPAGRVFDLGLAEADVQPVAGHVRRLAQGHGRYQDPASGQPRPGVHDEVPDRPLLGIEVHVVDAPDVAIERAYGQAFQGRDRAQHRILLTSAEIAVSPLEVLSLLRRNCCATEETGIEEPTAPAGRSS